MCDAIPQRVLRSDGKMRNPIFAAFALLYLAAQVMRNELVPIANAEHRKTRVQDLRIDVGTSGFIDAGRAARDDKALARPQHRSWRIARLDVRVNTEFPNTARDEMRILPARIKNGYLWSRYGGLQSRAARP